ncbi:hypothetical protein Trydic_g18814 [Trypoxylus dichotomus]
MPSGFSQGGPTSRRKYHSSASTTSLPKRSPLNTSSPCLFFGNQIRTTLFAAIGIINIISHFHMEAQRKKAFGDKVTDLGGNDMGPNLPIHRL